MIDRDGVLNLTLTDGTVRDLGPVLGRDGADGRDGVDGAPGERGDVGEAGERGLPGQDGQDAYHGEARGLYDPEAKYRRLDVVSLNGSEWRAKIDNPGELPGEGWMLSAGRGKRGEKGDRGEDGRAGKAGPEIVAAYLDPGAQHIVLTKDDGTEIKIDLSALATRP